MHWNEKEPSRENIPIENDRDVKWNVVTYICVLETNPTQNINKLKI